MKGSRLLFLALAFVFALGLAVRPAALWAAESDTGSIDGNVFDETKAAVPGATVTAKNVSTGLTRTAVASASGSFHIGGLPAGTYDVTAELTGFGAVVNKAVPVQVASQSTVDFTLKVGAQAETITVTGETPLIQTTKSDVGQVITSAMIENIPLNGRKFQDLSLLVPGTRSSNYYDPTKTEVGGISYGGGTGRNVIINVDGGDNNDGVVRGLLQQFTADAIQEYKVTTQRYSAEFGRSTGGVVNVITKSGTNDFHGSAFVFGRDQRLNSLSFFEKQAKDEGSCDSSGQSVCKSPFKQQQFGGSLGGPIVKDRSHFFVAYERNRRDDFSRVDTAGALPAEEGAFASPFRNHLLTAKIDFALGNSNNLIARYSLEDQKRDHDFIGGNTLASSGATNTNKIHSGIIKDTTVLGNNKLNELLVLFSRFENNITAENPNIPGIQTPSFFYGANLNTPQQTIQKRFQARDDFSFRKEGWGGDHDFKVGAEVLRSHFGGFFTPTVYGYFIFNQDLGTDINNYLNALADTFSGSAGDNAFDDNWTYVAGYVQDDWKPTSKLTLNLGLRYEIQSGPYTNRFDTVSLRALEAVGAPTERKLDKNNWGPRVGFAYDVSGDSKYVVRGGYGRYYDEIFQNITLYEYWSQVNSPTFFISTAPNFTPNEYIANRDAIRNSFIDPTFAGQLLRLTAPDLQQPYNDQFNVGFSLQPNHTFAFDVDYVHTTGKEEIHRWRINTPQNVSTRISPAGVFAPDLGAILVEGNRGRSKFDGVYVTGKVRTAKTTVIATYAWSKALNCSNDFNSQPADITNSSIGNGCEAGGGASSDFAFAPNDVRHRGTVGAVFQIPWGFQYSTSFQANTGRPFSALAGLGGIRNSVRAIDPATGQMFERNSFRAGPDVVTSNGGSGGLAFMSWDMRLSKVFKMGKDRSIEALFEVFNITNHANFNRDNYITRFTSPAFGTATDILKNSQRQAEAGLRFRF
jgi:outer membrane receptor protein involved in Fe transport